MARERTVTISRESYLEPLGLSRHRHLIRTPEQEQQLYELIVDFLAEKDALLRPSEAGTEETELPFKVPGLPLHIRLSAPTKDELNTFAGIAALVVGAATGNVLGLTVGAILAVATRIQWLKAQYGEVCLVESVSESQPPSVREITLTLYGQRCRRPKAGCQFHQKDTNTCGLSPDAVTKTLADLEERNVVKRLNVVEPIEYGIVV
jgi:hypothetical protein